MSQMLIRSDIAGVIVKKGKSLALTLYFLRFKIVVLSDFRTPISNGIQNNFTYHFLKFLFP